MFMKASRERWPFITIDKKGDICVNSEICSHEMIELADSRAWWAKTAFSAAQNPYDFPVKSGSQIYFINVRTHLLMCS